MATSAEIDSFLNHKSYAVAGASRNPHKYGYRIYRILKEHNYQVYPINPNAPAIDGDTCYPDLSALPVVPDGVVLITPPEQSEMIVQEASRLGIRQIWLQPGAESGAVVRACQKNGQNVVTGECLFVVLPGR